MSYKCCKLCVKSYERGLLYEWNLILWSQGVMWDWKIDGHCFQCDILRNGVNSHYGNWIRLLSLWGILFYSIYLHRISFSIWDQLYETDQKNKFMHFPIDVLLLLRNWRFPWPQPLRCYEYNSNIQVSGQFLTNICKYFWQICQ